MTEYETFLRQKAHADDRYGFKPSFLPDCLFGFQKHLTNWALRKGRAALLEDCGLGKSVQELCWAENIVRKENKPVLILTPLAVSPQMVREGDKFGIPCKITRQGKVHKGINVTNYERLEYFDHKDFAAVVADECFPAGTPVDVINPLDNSLEKRYIEDVLPGDLIINANGVDRVRACKKRRVDGAIRFSAGGAEFTCSKNHPFFTMHGWKPAKDLQAGDYLVETKTAMCLVRGDFPAEICGQCNGEVLREVLLSEMADECAGAQRESTYQGNPRQDRPCSESLAQRRKLDSLKEQGTYSLPQSNGQSRVSQENDRNEEQERNAPTMEGQTGRERHRSHCAGTNSHGSFGQRLETIGDSHREKQDFPLPLQNRRGQHEAEDSNRGRRVLPSQQKRSRCSQGCILGFVRVESVEILQQDHSELEKFRDAKGSLYFYDLEIERHPSFSVNGVLVHNSSCLKNHTGKRRRQITDFLLKVKYRLLCTATPSPNDWMELGTSSEALGAMSRGQMLGMFFTNGGKSTQQWTLKGHAKRRFWRWVCTWARALRKPSDLGFDDKGFDLPELKTELHLVNGGRSNRGFGYMPARTLDEQRAERRLTLKERCEKVASLVPKSDYAVVWCHLNEEGNLLERLIPNAVQVQGSDRDEVKEERLTAFSNGEIKTLITKPKIGGFGLNWQHCNFMTTFPSHSYEGFYQAVRRCWRFGQKRPVSVHVVAGRRESMVLSNMQRKERQADELFTALVESMQEFQLGKRAEEADVKVRMPAWL